MVQEDFAVWNVDDEEHPFLEETATLIEKVFVGFQTAMEVPNKNNALWNGCNQRRTHDN